MRATILVCLILLTTISAGAQKASPVGIWKTVDDETGKAKSHVQIYEEKGLLKGKVIKLLEGATATVCSKCTGDKKNKPIVGLVFLDGLKKDGKTWSGGTILDPAKGKEYKCVLWLENDNTLTVRGYIGIQALGRSQTWHRVE